jgi:hypothetical protein
MFLLGEILDVANRMMARQRSLHDQAIGAPHSISAALVRVANSPRFGLVAVWLTKHVFIYKTAKLLQEAVTHNNRRSRQNA